MLKTTSDQSDSTTTAEARPAHNQPVQQARRLTAIRISGLGASTQNKNPAAAASSVQDDAPRGR